MRKQHVECLLAIHVLKEFNLIKYIAAHNVSRLKKKTCFNTATSNKVSLEMTSRNSIKLLIKHFANEIRKTKIRLIEAICKIFHVSCLTIVDPKSDKAFDVLYFLVIIKKTSLESQNHVF